MKGNRVLRVAAGTMALASVPVLTAACDASDSNTTATATPPPQGQGASTQIQSQAPEVNGLFVDSDTVRGSKNVPAGSTDGCVQTSQFGKGEQIVFRIRVYDQVTGEPLDDTQIDRIIVTLRDGTELDPARYGVHPTNPAGESFWTAAFMIPPEYPTGSLDYMVTATAKDGRSGTFVPLPYDPEHDYVS